MKRIPILMFLATFAGLLSGHAAIPEQPDNIVIDNEIQTYTITVKNGEIASVK